MEELDRKLEQAYSDSFQSISPSEYSNTLAQYQVSI
jgi:hypothetical protein